MTTPLRVRRSRLSGHRLPANTICVSRGTRWGNPYRVGYDGDAECCVRKYRDYLLPYSHRDGDLSGFLRAEAKRSEVGDAGHLAVSTRAFDFSLRYNDETPTGRQSCRGSNSPAF